MLILFSLVLFASFTYAIDKGNKVKSFKTEILSTKSDTGKVKDAVNSVNTICKKIVEDTVVVKELNKKIDASESLADTEKVALKAIVNAAPESAKSITTITTSVEDGNKNGYTLDLLYKIITAVVSLFTILGLLAKNVVIIGKYLNKFFKFTGVQYLFTNHRTKQAGEKGTFKTVFVKDGCEIVIAPVQAEKR